MASALLILRTPFQAWQAERVLLKEAVVKYDLIYLTQNDSAEDRYYFDRLSARASKSHYCYVRPMKPDIRNHLAFRWRLSQWFQAAGYETVLVASIDELVPNALATRHGGELITFDDGSANIYPYSTYRNDLPSTRMQIYRRLFGAQPIGDMVSRISRHYTVHPELGNIVEKDRLRELKISADEFDKASGRPKLNVFIGQPFHEVLSEQQIKKLHQYLAVQQFDFYVQHPREKNPLIKNVPLLNKRGRIAEDAMLQVAKGRDIHIVGWFSSVLFNMHSLAECNMILLKDDPRTPSMAELAEQMGCEVVLIS